MHEKLTSLRDTPCWPGKRKFIKNPASFDKSIKQLYGSNGVTFCNIQGYFSKSSPCRTRPKDFHRLTCPMISWASFAHSASISS